MKTKILFFAGLVLISLNSIAQSGDKILLNKKYKVRVVEDYNTSDSNSWKDEIIFKNNKIYFRVFSKHWDFPYVECIVSVDSNSKAITFESERTFNDEGDSRTLKGIITPDYIKGFVEIIRSDDIKRPYSFSGKIK